MKKPSNLSPTSPRLSEQIKGPLHPYICQHCSGSNKQGFGAGVLRLSIDRWQEHDHNDKPERVLIVLCEKCGRSLVPSHVRLYERLSANTPWPGCMDICVDCDFRAGTACTHRQAKANGGTGVMLTIAAPSHAMVDGRDYRGPVTLWTSPASACAQKKENPELRKNPLV